MVDCILETVSLWEPYLEYTALSYTWGEPTPTAAIRIDGMVVQVRVNLEQALQRIQQISTPVCLWVDAICIDQSNEQEKSEQVQRMHNIYQRAASVFVWLGEAADDSETAMEALEAMGREGVAADIVKLSAKDISSTHKSLADAKEVAIEKILDGITKKEEQRKHVEDPDNSAEVLFQIRFRHQSAYGSSPETLVDLLRRECVGNGGGADQRVSDPRDIVYGLLGIASDRAKLDIKPDYSKTVEHVYSDCTRQLIEHCHFEVLAWCQYPRSLLELPSWVPDLSSRIQTPCGEEWRHRLFDASGERKTYASSSSTQVAYNASTLRLFCAAVCSIKNRGRTWKTDPDAEFDFSAANQYFLDIASYCTRAALSQLRTFFSNRDGVSQFDVGSITRIRSHLEEAKWRIPTGDLECQGVERFRASPSLKNGYNELRKWIDEQPASHMRIRSHACETYMLALQKMHARRPFLSIDGHVGLVPAGAEVDDVVAIVQGADVPFVFRK
ncbi:MAG: hypothetical protein MMC33_010623, partial [Icmadophila ericetorum]|nr:hypothetical protein [Icmadophila ericetorum]